MAHRVHTQKKLKWDFLFTLNGWPCACYVEWAHMIRTPSDLCGINENQSGLSIGLYNNRKLSHNDDNKTFINDFNWRKRKKTTTSTDYSIISIYFSWFELPRLALVFFRLYLIVYLPTRCCTSQISCIYWRILNFFSVLIK